ncbi:MAG TPA: dihydroorotase [candidate division WOR-3 bacterium]|uniref:Dihydroorotase n=1 Tax=candidate division WOR-3 bacterium TaxID=2052148 RepID=A0A7V0XEC9_UNCW3|nr:dihydroorotase [candidate division WOR-3 bacterium]
MKIRRLLLKGGTVVDPAAGRNRRVNVLVENGRVTGLARNLSARGAEVVDCRGRYIAPGFVDLHCHLREPGAEDAETVASGTRAALAGGFTRVCAMPNTDPPVDSEAMVRFLVGRGESAGLARVHPVGCCTRARQGRELAEIGGMVAAGAVAFSDDGNWVADARVMRSCLEYCKAFDKPVFAHCEMTGLDTGVAHEGPVSTRLGLAGKPDAGEAAAAARDILLAHLTGTRLHLCHVSCAATVELVRWAKGRGTAVTAEACPHHFTLTDEALAGYDTNFKVNPPLRGEADRRAVLAGLADGTIDAIATDHAPHTRGAKEVEFDNAPAGMVGLETAFSLGYEALVLSGLMRLPQFIARLTAAPAEVIGLPVPRIAVGAEAELVVLDLREKWTCDRDKLVSRSRNTPFAGRTLVGRVQGGILPGGRMWGVGAD